LNSSIKINSTTNLIDCNNSIYSNNNNNNNSSIIEEKEYLQLINWKNDVNKKTKEYITKKKLVHDYEKMESLQTHEKLLDFINIKTKILTRNTNLKKKIMEQEEVNRLEKRKYDKNVIKLKKFEIYLNNERNLMIFEDKLSSKLRFFYWEKNQILIENKNMFVEEKKQRKFDNYWGIDLFQKNLKDEENFLKQKYIDKIIELNTNLVKMKVIKPCLPILYNLKNENNANNNINNNNKILKNKNNTNNNDKNTTSINNKTKNLKISNMIDLEPLLLKNVNNSNNDSKFPTNLNNVSNYANKFNKTEQEVQEKVSMSQHEIIQKFKAEEVRGNCKYKFHSVTDPYF
jgi:hypothetical protein